MKETAAMPVGFARRNGIRSIPPSRRGSTFWKQLESDLAEVIRHCRDRDSRRRLEHLRKRLATQHYGVRESAIAELELAGKFVGRGAYVYWLPESQARTADLECRVAEEQLFVEVTAMVGAFRQTHGIPAHRALFLHDPDGPLTEGDVLIHRILARIAQKARQLSDYAAPVLLAVSVPPQEEVEGTARQLVVELDLRRLAGAMTTALLGINHLSGVLLSLWDVAPLPASSAVRLANVGLVERNRYQTDQPKVRLLVRNPVAAAPLPRRQEEIVRQIL